VRDIKSQLRWPYTDCAFLCRRTTLASNVSGVPKTPNWGETCCYRTYLAERLEFTPLKKPYRRRHYFVELHRRNILPNTYAWARLAAWRNAWPTWATTNEGMHLVSDHGGQCLVVVYWMPSPPRTLVKFLFEDSHPWRLSLQMIHNARIGGTLFDSSKPCHVCA
jgi:hypothetical protein